MGNSMIRKLIEKIYLKIYYVKIGDRVWVKK